MDFSSSVSLLARGTDGPPIIQAPNFPPYTNPTLTANLVCRVLLAIFADIICLVPLRMLYRNGEFAGVVFITVVEFKNIQTTVNTLIWRNDDTASWWAGYGLCDMNPYFHHFCLGLYVTCMLAIIRNVAQQVGLLRASPLTVKEKRRRNLVQALIMFPLPIAQAALTWPLMAQRYGVGTLVGCLFVAYPTWLYLIFFVVVPACVTVAAASYAVLAYIRFRQIAKSTQSALSSSRLANRRAQRTRRRLYLMITSIIIPFTPITLAILVMNIIRVQPIVTYSYSGAHHHQYPYPWNAIYFITSENIDFVIMNEAYIASLTAIPIFLFFGLTKDAVNDYRRTLLFFGLGKLFSGLNQEYDPDRGHYDSSLGSSNIASSAIRTPSSKLGSFTSTEGMTATSTSSGESSRAPQMQSLNFVTAVSLEAGQQQQQATRTEPAPRSEFTHDTPTLFRNPFPLRTRLGGFLNPLRLPMTRAGETSHQSTLDDDQDNVEPTHPLRTLRRASLPRHWDSDDQPQVQTRVWSHDQIGRHSTDEARDDQHPSKATADCVVVETALTRESHQTGEH